MLIQNMSFIGLVVHYKCKYDYSAQFFLSFFWGHKFTLISYTHSDIILNTYPDYEDRATAHTEKQV